MKKIFSLALVVIFLSCVEEPGDLTTDHLFKISCNTIDISNAEFIANNSTKYLFDLETLDNIDIKNNKVVTISVSDGSVFSLSNMTLSSQINISIIDNKLSFYYVAGRKAKTGAVLTATVEGISQTFMFNINPSEPDIIQLTTPNSNPHVASPLDLTVYLKKSSAIDNYVSNDLPIYFTYTQTNPSASISLTPPDFSLSLFNDTLGVIAKTTLTNTNQMTGNVDVIAHYTKQNGEDLSSNTIHLNYIP